MDKKYYLYICHNSDDRPEIECRGPYPQKQEWIEKSNNYIKTIEFELSEDELL